MIGFPKVSEVSKPLPKTQIYKTFGLTNKEQSLIDENFSTLEIVNEVTPDIINISDGKVVHAFFIVKANLKLENYNKDSLIKLFHMIKQRFICVLCYGDKVSLAVYKTGLFTTNWASEREFNFKFSGLNFDDVWNNLFSDIACLDDVIGSSIDERIKNKLRCQTLEEEITALKIKEKKESQPKKKMALHDRLIKDQNELNGLRSIK